MGPWMKGLGLGLMVWAALAGRSSTAPAEEPMPPHETFVVQSAVLGEARRINIYKPPGTGTGTGSGDGRARFPVLYMLDGGVKEDFPHVSTAVDAAIREGALRPLILVGIENTERRRDLTPPTDVESDRKIAPRIGGSAKFRAFLSRELRPEIDRRYGVATERGIIGESLAGLFVIETLLEEPTLFQRYVALSPSLWWNNELIVKNAAGRLKTGTSLRGAFLLVAAKEDELVTVRLADAFRSAVLPGMKFQYVPRPDLLHENIYRSLAPWVLRQVFAPDGKESKK